MWRAARSGRVRPGQAVGQAKEGGRGGPGEVIGPGRASWSGRAVSGCDAGCVRGSVGPGDSVDAGREGRSTF